MRRVLVADDSIGGIVGRSSVAATDLAVVEPLGQLRDTSPPRRLKPVRGARDCAVEHIGARPSRRVT